MMKVVCPRANDAEAIASSALSQVMNVLGPCAYEGAGSARFFPRA